MELSRFRRNRQDRSDGFPIVVRRACFPRRVLDLAQEHTRTKSILAQERPSEAGDNSPLRGRVPIITVLAALAAIVIASAGAGRQDAPGQSPPTVLTLPSIGGTYREGQTLSADPGAWGGPERNYAFQWVRCDTTGSYCAPIIAGTGQHHLIIAADVGSSLRIVVTATNKNGSTVATSEPTPVIAPSLTIKSISTTSIPTTTTTTPTTNTTTTTTTAATTTTASTTSSQPYFSEDFEKGYTSMCVSAGGSPPGYVNWPASGFSGNGVELVDPVATNNAGQSIAVHMDCNPTLYAAAHATTGNDTWYRVKLRFPANYQPPAVWSYNWLVEWHNDDHTAVGFNNNALSMGMEVLTDGPEGYYPGNNPRLAFRLAGGSSTSPTYITRQMPSNSLLRDHWYDLLFHFIWSPSASIGKFEWWVDGRLIDSENFPTIYSNPDGTLGRNGFGLYNYHPGLSWETRVHFDELRIGPDRASVGG
jgi:hypothetical protein